MKKHLLKILTAAFFTAIVIQACTKDDDDTDPPVIPPMEFIADGNTFTNYANWSLDATNMGPDPALGTMAHGGNDSTVTRNVYFKGGLAPVNGVYPLGTVIVKRSTNPGGTVNETTAMAKRGNNFNPGYGDWEFFVLDENGKIMSDSSGMKFRGAGLFQGFCRNCHASATTDFVYSK